MKQAYKREENIDSDILDYEPIEVLYEKQYYWELLILYISSLAASYLLFALDVKTQHISDLLTIKMAVLAQIFTIPAFLVAAFLFEKLVKSRSEKRSMLISLAIAIPLVFLLILWFLGHNT